MGKVFIFGDKCGQHQIISFLPLGHLRRDPLDIIFYLQELRIFKQS